MDIKDMNLAGKAVAASELLKEAAELLNAQKVASATASEAAFDALVAAGLAPEKATKKAFIDNVGSDNGKAMDIIKKLANDLASRDKKIAQLQAAPASIGRPAEQSKTASIKSTESADHDARWNAAFGG